MPTEGQTQEHGASNMALTISSTVVIGLVDTRSCMFGLDFFFSHAPSVQGLRHADENGGGGGRGPGGGGSRIFVRGNPYQKPKSQRIWPTIFLKMGGGIIPRSLKNGGDASPRPPLWRSPCLSA